MTKIPHISPIITVNELGQIKWTKPNLDYNDSLYQRGKVVTHGEFNDLFVSQVTHSNYTADSLEQFFTKYFPDAVYRQVQHNFDFALSYVRLYGTEDWGEPHEDGYYYITIPATEHGIMPNLEDDTMQTTVEATMYVLDTEQNIFYELDQTILSRDNTVQIYTDDNTIIGYAVIRVNNKVYTVATQKIDASQINGLHRVAMTGDYDDLLNSPTELIESCKNNITEIINGTKIVGNAHYAHTAGEANAIPQTATLAGIPFMNIFESGTSAVKLATEAKNYVEDGTIDKALKDLLKKASDNTSAVQTLETDFNTLIANLNTGSTVVERANNAESAVNATNAQYALYANEDTSKGTIEERLTRLGFKWGTISFAGSSYGPQDNQDNIDTALNGVFRQGNYVFGNLNVTLKLNNSTTLQDYFRVNKVLFELSENFRPKSTKKVWVIAKVKDSSYYLPFDVSLDTEGKATVLTSLANEFYNETVDMSINFGYEAVAIK